MNYRSTLEVAKYLPDHSVLRLGLVSRSWNHVAVCDELWSTLLEGAGLAEYRCSGSFKNSYRLQKQNQYVLAFIKQGRVLRYNCGRRKWQPAVVLSEYPVQIDDASLTLLPEGSLMVLGIITRDSSKAVYSVSAQGSIERLRDTLNIRVKTGALCCRGVVYAFGSLSYGEGRTCEKLVLRSCTALEQNTWQPLPDMLDSRFRFVPVEFAGSVYLNGGWCNTCEAPYLDAQEVMAASPKIYAQMVPILKPFSKFNTGSKSAEEISGSLRVAQTGTVSLKASTSPTSMALKKLRSPMGR